MPYAIRSRSVGRDDYVYITGGIINQTRRKLALEWPHLVRTWSKRSHAKAVITRIVNTYGPDSPYGDRRNYTIEEFSP